MKKKFILTGILLALFTFGSYAQYWSPTDDAPFTNPETGTEYVSKSKSVERDGNQHVLYTPGIKEGDDTTYFYYYTLEPKSYRYTFGYTKKGGLYYNEMYYFPLEYIKDKSDHCVGFADTKGGRINVMEGYTGSFARMIEKGEYQQFKDLIISRVLIDGYNRLKYYEADATDKGVKSLDGEYVLPRNFDFWDKVEFVDYINIEDNELTLLFYNDSLLQYELYGFDNTLDTTTNKPGWEKPKLMKKVGTPGVQSEEGSGYYVYNNKVYVAGKDGSIVSFGSGIDPDTVFQPTDFNGETIKATHVYGVAGNKLIFNYYDVSKGEFRIFYSNNELLKEFSRFNRDDDDNNPMYQNQSDYYNVVTNDDFTFLTYHHSRSASRIYAYKIENDTIQDDPNIDGYGEDAYFTSRDGKTYFFDGRGNWYVNAFLGQVQETMSQGDCPGDTVELVLQVNQEAAVKWYSYTGYNSDASDTTLLEGKTNDTLLITRDTKDTHFYAEATFNGETAISQPYTLEIPDGTIPEFTKQLSVENGCPGDKTTLEFNLSESNYDSAKWYMDGQLIDYVNEGNYREEDFKINLSDTTVGMYNVVIYGGTCSYGVSSDTVKADTLGLPVIESDLADIVGCEGSELGKVIVARETDGSKPYSFMVKKAQEKDAYSYGQWYSTYSNDTLVMDEVFSPADTGYYFVKAEGKCGTTVSDTFEISLGHSFTIGQAPSRVQSSVFPGEEKTLEVQAVSESTINYQWYLDSVPIEGANGNVLELTDIDTSHAGAYYVNVNTACLDTTLDATDLSVINSYSLNFAAGDNGNLSGETDQTIVEGNDASEVEAIADEGYQFVEWQDSDSNTYSADNPLTVTGITEDLALTAIFESSTSIRKANAVEFALYPNPADDYVYIEGPAGNFDVSLYSLTGNVVLNKTAVQNILKLDVSDLEQGVYMIKVTYQGSESVYKLIK